MQRKYKPLTTAELEFVKANLHRFTNMQLMLEINKGRSEADKIFNLDGFRNLVNRRGIKRKAGVRWTSAEVEFLLENYQKIGNVELAKLLNKNFGRTHHTKKTVEKKCLHMQLNRTPEEIKAIKRRNCLDQGFVEIWQRKSVIMRTKPVGTIRNVRYSTKYQYPEIKTETGWKFLHIYIWEQHYGPVEPDYCIVFKNYDLENRFVIENMQKIHRNKLATILTEKRLASYMSVGNEELRSEILKNKELLQLKKIQLELKKTIKNEISNSK